MQAKFVHGTKLAKTLDVVSWFLCKLSAFTEKIEMKNHYLSVEIKGNLFINFTNTISKSKATSVGGECFVRSIRKSKYSS